MTSQNTSSLISMVYKSRSVLLSLMKKQHYNTSEYEGFSVNEINTMKTNNQLDMILEKKYYIQTNDKQVTGEMYDDDTNPFLESEFDIDEEQGVEA